MMNWVLSGISLVDLIIADEAKHKCEHEEFSAELELQAECYMRCCCSVALSVDLKCSPNECVDLLVILS